MMQSSGSESASPITHRLQSLSAADTRGKHRIQAELKRLEQEARCLEVSMLIFSNLSRLVMGVWNSVNSQNDTFFVVFFLVSLYMISIVFVFVENVYRVPLWMRIGLYLTELFLMCCHRNFIGLSSLTSDEEVCYSNFVESWIMKIFELKHRLFGVFYRNGVQSFWAVLINFMHMKKHYRTIEVVGLYLPN